MSGLKEKTWKKWKENKTTSPESVTDKKPPDTVTSQRSSSLIRSRKRNTVKNKIDNVLPAENAEVIVPRTPTDKEKNRNRDAEQKNDLRNKATSPFNTLAATANPFNIKNTIIVGHGQVEDDKTNFVSDKDNPNELWGELPADDVAESPKPTRAKGPKGGSKRPDAVKTAHYEPSAPPASPTNENAPPSPPSPFSGPSAPPGPSGTREQGPRSGQSHNRRRSRSLNPENGMCDFPECPAHGIKPKEVKQKERLCMAPECPVTMKKAVVKEAKKAMKKPCGRKRKNPLTYLGAVLMSAFAGRDSTCKLTKEEKKAMKRMKEAEEEVDDNNDPYSNRQKKSKGTQCRAPMSSRGPEKANKSTACDLPECPIAIQKARVKQFMDKGQLCNIPSCPIKEPPPRKEKPKEKEKEKKVEPAKGCPSKPCTLKTKDEEFLNQLDPSIFDKMPRLKMTCEQVLAERKGPEYSTQRQNDNNNNNNQAAAASAKYKEHKTKDKDKGVKIIAAHVHAVQPSENNPFLTNVQSKVTAGRESEKMKENGESEYKKLLDRRSSAPTVVPDFQTEGFEFTKSRTIGGKSAPRIRFSNHLMNDEDSLKLKIEQTVTSSKVKLKLKTSGSTKSATTSSEQSLKKTNKTNDIHRFETTNQVAKESLNLISLTGIEKSNDFSKKPFRKFHDEQLESPKFEKLEQDDYPSTKKLDMKTLECGSTKLDFEHESKKKWPLITDPVKLLSVLPLGYSSVYEATSDRVFDVSSMKNCGIKLLEGNLNTTRNSEARVITGSIPVRNLDFGRGRSRTNSHVNEAGCSIERYKKEIQSREDERTEEYGRAAKSVNENEENKVRRTVVQGCTQTLATSVISPNLVNTVAIGGDSTIGLKSETPSKLKIKDSEAAL